MDYPGLPWVRVRVGIGYEPRLEHEKGLGMGGPPRVY